jgi:transposase
LPYKAQRERLDAIPRVDSLTAWTILTELGPDASAFADDRHAASWAGLCPGNHESGGKRQSGRTGHGNRYIRRALCQAARAAARSKGTYPAALYRRMLPRTRDQAAIIAVAHWLLVVSYHILRDSSEYYELGDSTNPKWCGVWSSVCILFHFCGFSIVRLLNAFGSELANLPCAPEKYRAPK